MKRLCTDKVAVRDYVREKIGEEYLKPVLQIIPDIDRTYEVSNSTPLPSPLPSGEGAKNSTLEVITSDFTTDNAPRNDAKVCNAFDDNNSTPHPNPLPTGEGAVAGENNELYLKKCTSEASRTNAGEGITLAKNNVSTYFDQIDFEKLPNSFVMKCNHGSKWQYIIKDKKDYLNNKRLFDITKQNMTGWLEQEFWVWNGFEMQYKGIEPKIIIEPLMKDDINGFSPEIEVFCFNGKPKYAVKLHNKREVTTYDEEMNVTEDLAGAEEFNKKEKADEILKQTYELSRILSKDFKFVRVDWMLYGGKAYFGELTFTPYSGYRIFKTWNNDVKLGSWINLERERT